MPHQPTYAVTANFGNGQATGQGIVALDTYPGRWISVQVSGLGAGSAAATFGFSWSNSPTVGFTGGLLQPASANVGASSSGLVTSLTTDTFLHGPIRARYVSWQTVTAATAGPTSSPATAFVTIWDDPGQTIG